jgi:hypothetical protein
MGGAFRHHGCREMIKKVSMPVIIRQDENPPGDNRAVGLIG